MTRSHERWEKVTTSKDALVAAAKELKDLIDVDVEEEDFDEVTGEF